MDREKQTVSTFLFDYFFLIEGAYDEFLSLDHIYPEEFSNMLEASDHIPVVLDLKEEYLEK